MECKIDGCGREAAYKKQQVCQKHYFRFMRNGYYHKKESRDPSKHNRKKAYRINNPAGYQSLHEPDHPLADKRGYVYEHRLVYFNTFNGVADYCELCGDPVNWKTCHIDHIDEDVTNNNEGNLRCLCIGCNTFRGHSRTSMGKFFLTIDGKTMTASAWARMPNVVVHSATIRRRKRMGMSDYEAVYSPRITHHKTKTKILEVKHDDLRDIPSIFNHS